MLTLAEWKEQTLPKFRTAPEAVSFCLARESWQAMYDAGVAGVRSPTRFESSGPWVRRAVAWVDALRIWDYILTTPSVVISDISSPSEQTMIVIAGASRRAVLFPDSYLSSDSIQELRETMPSLASYYAGRLQCFREANGFGDYPFADRMISRWYEVYATAARQEEQEEALRLHREATAQRAEALLRKARLMGVRASTDSLLTGHATQIVMSLDEFDRWMSLIEKKKGA